MRKISERTQTDRQLVEIVGALNEMKPWEASGFQAGFEAKAKRWANRLLAVASACFCILVLLAATRLMGPLSPIAVTCALVLVVGIELLAIVAMLLQIAGDIASEAMRRKRIGRDFQSEISHDYGLAAKLAVYPLEVLDAADRWLEQKSRRMERGLARFFGGSDKLALVVLVAGAWAAWKEIGPALVSLRLSPVLFGSALLVGLVVGGVVVSWQMARLSYQRDLLQIAKTFETTPAEH